MAESLAGVIVDAGAKEVPPPPRCTYENVWCETAEPSAAIKKAWNARDDARRFMHIKRDEIAWTALKAACATLRGVIDAGLFPYSEEYLTDLSVTRGDSSLTTTCGVSTNT